MEVFEYFILFAMQKKYRQNDVDLAKNISARKDIEPPQNLSGLKDHIMESEEIHKLYDGVEGDHPKWWNTVFLPNHDKLFFGEISADEFIDIIKEQTINFHNEN